ncbi:hypothetical protein K7X08_033248 [Anisodus acutangulus]|uniref:Uncharacterized protein n=1 Tax=Anisodus acutangulus TaxID=402998 RepID=A0A9Q1RBZ1_9SOLA|nr:hypothetical protein K7X08_033248 [Anisodus acutangulus]
MSSPTSNVYRKTTSSDNEERGSFSSELWKKALEDACEMISLFELENTSVVGCVFYTNWNELAHILFFNNGTICG